MSHPTWVRGLKQNSYDTVGDGDKSHPTWVRGLKLWFAGLFLLVLSRTLRGCVD